MISKELLGEVLDLVGYIETVDTSVNGNYVYYYSSYIAYPAKEHKINIHELAHKCKAWAIEKNDYIIESAYFPKGNFTSSYCRVEKFLNTKKQKKIFSGNTEPEAVFKACQWILDNTGNKND